MLTSHIISLSLRFYLCTRTEQHSMISKITFSSKVPQLKSTATESLSSSQGGTLKTRVPGDESGTNSDYLGEESASILDCAHPTPQIYGVLFLEP